MFSQSCKHLHSLCVRFISSDWGIWLVCFLADHYIWAFFFRQILLLWGVFVYWANSPSSSCFYWQYIELIVVITTHFSINGRCIIDILQLRCKLHLHKYHTNCSLLTLKCTSLYNYVLQTWHQLYINSFNSELKFPNNLINILYENKYDKSVI